MIHKNLMEIADNFDTFFFDAWGVFNIGGEISKSAIAVMAELVSRGKSVSVMSNTPQTADGVIAHYGKKGLTAGVHFQNVFSSGQLCADAALRGDIPVPGKCYYIAWDFTNGLAGGGESYNMFTGSDYIQVKDINKADFVYLDFPRADGEFILDEAGLKPELDKIIGAGKPVVCANPDEYCFIEGDFYIMQGLVSKIMESRGVNVIYYGKPYPEIYFNAMKKLGDIDPFRTLMIGDTLHTDILGATRAGIKSCLTLAGGISARDIGDLTEENIIAAGEKIGAVPDYIIERVPLESL